MTTNCPVRSRVERIATRHRPRHPEPGGPAPLSAHGGQTTVNARKSGTQNRDSCRNTDHLISSMVTDAMRQLSVEHRAVIYRSYYQGWTTAEIAASLQLTEAAVQSRLHSGLYTLRVALRQMGVAA